MPEIPELIEAYAADLKRRGAIKSAMVERAFRRVARHRLVEGVYVEDETGECHYGRSRFSLRKLDPNSPDPDLLKLVYSDIPLLTRIAPPSSSSQPYLVAQMLELLELGEGMNVLEIGAGTGYNAALIQEIVGEAGRVTTLDIQEDVVAQTERLLRAAGYGRIEVIAKDGAVGHAENAPYDRIVATVGCSDISWRWAAQLNERGFMLIPLQHGAEGFDPLTRIWREKDTVRGRFVGWSGFMSIRGELEIEQPLSYENQDLADPPRAEFPPASSSEEWAKLLGKSWKELTEDERPRYFDLPIFLVVSGWCVFWVKDGVGIWDAERGGLVAGKDKIAVYGEESVFPDVKSLYAKWDELGRPGVTDWELEFYPRGPRPQVSRQDVTYCIERKFSTEIARVGRG